MEQAVHFCMTVDAVRIAYAVYGQGPAIVVPPASVSRIDPRRAGPFYGSLAEHYTIVQFDRHGCGLSDRDRTDFSLAPDLRALEAVVDHLKLRRFALLGASAGGPMAITYAAGNPRRVSHLLLYGTRAYLDPAATPRRRSCAMPSQP